MNEENERKIHKKTVLEEPDSSNAPAEQGGASPDDDTVVIKRKRKPYFSSPRKGIGPKIGRSKPKTLDLLFDEKILKAVMRYSGDLSIRDLWIRFVNSPFDLKGTQLGVFRNWILYRGVSTILFAQLLSLMNYRMVIVPDDAEVTVKWRGVQMPREKGQHLQAQVYGCVETTTGQMGLVESSSAEEDYTWSRKPPNQMTKLQAEKRKEDIQKMLEAGEV